MHPQADSPVSNGGPFQPESSRSNPLNDPYDGRAGMASPMKGKEKQQCAGQRTGPLRLLDLPLDVLKDIIKEVTHTNDLTALALTHSALHNIAIPQIYSRFDIVWPDAHTSSEPRSGVDALTFGLATLVMREDLFDYTPAQNGQPGRNSCVEYSCNHCGMTNHVNEDTVNTTRHARRPRRGNLFSQYTRKFSLGNGPPDWVQEYLITKEAGKMLGTLVALTIARMPNLETFVWDMPTGVLREVWEALANTSRGRRPRLEKVWVRFHDNKEVLAVTAPSMVSNTSAPLPNPTGVPTTSDPYPSLTTDMASMSSLELSYKNTECPSLSILPPLKSLTVLEIDEPAYLAEMSVLIERSVRSLRELRVGISNSYSTSPSIRPQRHDKDPDIQYLAHGGFLGLIMSKLYDCRPNSKPEDQEGTGGVANAAANVIDQGPPQTTVLPLSALYIGEEPRLAGPASIKLPDSPDEVEYAETTPGFSVAGTSLTFQEPSRLVGSYIASSLSLALNGPDPEPAEESKEQLFSNERHRLDKSVAEYTVHPTALEAPRRDRLSLEVLELEKIPMHVPVLQHSIDWSILTNLTLLQCWGHEELWKTLKRKYSPKSSGSLSISSPQTSSGQGLLRRRTSSRFDPLSPSDYRLNLKKIHTDSVSPALIAFLKDALAPNSLEWLILQDRGKYESSVTVDTIYRGPIRYHRSSLKKLSIDASEKAPDSRSRSSKWKKWMLNREILTFITSGKMGSLRELGMAVDYKDWHLFLQRLPNIPHLRSLYVPHIANHSYAHHIDAKELASQVVNIVIALRPEIELCYMGILTKCFEILENRNHDESRFSSHDSRTNSAHAGPGGVGDSDGDSDGSDDDHDDDDDDDSDNSPLAPAVPANNNAEDSDSEESNGHSSYTDDEANDEGNGKCAPKFRLREILFYDDKISIFKARHGRL